MHIIWKHEIDTLFTNKSTGNHTSNSTPLLLVNNQILQFSKTSLYLNTLYSLCPVSLTLNNFKLQLLNTPTTNIMVNGIKGGKIEEKTVRKYGYLKFPCIIGKAHRCRKETWCMWHFVFHHGKKLGGVNWKWPCHTWPDRPNVQETSVIRQCSFYVLLLSAKCIRVRRCLLQIHSCVWGVNIFAGLIISPPDKICL